MPIWSRLFGRKEEKRRVSLEQALEIAAKRLAELDLTGGQKRCGEMKGAVDDVAARIKELSAAPLPKIDSRLAAPVVESRKQIVLNVARCLDETVFPEKISPESLQRFNAGVKRALARISAGNIKHSYYTSLAFQPRMDAIGKAVMRLANLSNRLGDEIERITLENAPYKRILQQSEELEKTKRLLKQTEREISEVQEKMGEREKKLRELSAETEKSPVENEQAGLAELLKNKENIEGRMFAQISVFSRAMRKYERAGNFDKKTGAVLRSYIEDPVKTFFADSENYLQKILFDIKRILPQLELKDGEKIAAALDSVDFEDLRALAEERRKAELQIKELQNKIRPEIEKKERLKAEIGSTALELKSMKTKHTLLGEELDQQRQTIAKLQDSLDNLVSNFPA